MSTRGDIGFIENGKVYCSYSHYDNHPENVVKTLMGYLIENGYEAYVQQIKVWGPRGGIRHLLFDSNWEDGMLADWFNDEKNPGPWQEELYNPKEEGPNDFGYIVHDNYMIDVYDWDNKIKTINPIDYMKYIFEGKRNLI